MLLQKIICCETRHIPQLCVSLQPEGLPPCTHGPYRLVSLQQSGAQPWWSRLPEQGRDGRSHIQVSIPVCCEICDGDGCTHAAGAVVEVQVSYRCGSRESDGWRTSLFVVPCLRLVGGDICSQEPCFTVMLQVHLELYLLRPEPCAMHRPEPPCPPLPLYPAPPRHPCSCHERR